MTAFLSPALMKKIRMIFTTLGSSLVLLSTSCEKKSPAEKAVDDVGDAVEEAVDETGDAVRKAD